MEMIAAHVGGPGQGFPCSLSSKLFDFVTCRFVVIIYRAQKETVSGVVVQKPKWLFVRRTRRCSGSSQKLPKPEMTICTRSVALTKLKRGRLGLNAFKGQTTRPAEGKRCSRARRSKPRIRKKQPIFSYPRVWKYFFAKIGFFSYPKGTFSYPQK